jgi:hypothetical protein
MSPNEVDSQKMNRNRIRNQEALTPILIPRIRPSWNELPPRIRLAVAPLPVILA